MITPQLETERLILREVRKDDLRRVLDCWMQDEDVSRYMWWKASSDIKDAEEFIDFELSNLENDQWNRWIIVLKSEDEKIGGDADMIGGETKPYLEEVIGTCLVFFNDEADSFEGADQIPPHYDISYNLGKAYWGKGYVTEAMKKVMEYAKNVMGVKEISTTYADVNEASGHVLSKLGFKCEKNVPYVCSAGEIVTPGKYCRCVL